MDSPTTIGSNASSVTQNIDRFRCKDSNYCVNGGECFEFDPGLKICYCADGFEGPDCADIILDLVHNKQNSELQTSMAVWILVGCLVTIFVIAILIMVYRTCSRDNTKSWKRWKPRSPASRDTIEGFTTTGLGQEKHQRKLWAINLPFFGKNNASKSIDCENEPHDEEAQRSSGHNVGTTSMPVTNKCSVTDGHVTIYLNKDKISVLTHGTKCSDNSSTTVNPSISIVNEVKTESDDVSNQGYVNKALEETI